MITIAYTRDVAELYSQPTLLAEEVRELIPKGQRLSVLRESSKWVKVISTKYGTGFIDKDLVQYDGIKTNQELAQDIIKTLSKRRGFDGFWYEIDEENQQEIIEDIVSCLKGIE